MTPETKQALNDLNRSFYAAVAHDFSATRQAPWPGWSRVLPHIPATTSRPVEILDLGCGNGRFASFLAAELSVPFHYQGLDSCEALLEQARSEQSGRAGIQFACADILGSPEFSDSLPQGSFDLVVAFGLLHHIPGLETRGELLSALATRLAPGGVLVVTAWQFGAHERFRSRLRSWQSYNEESEHPIDLDSLEPGDHLLGWQTSPLPRYCHFSDAAELRHLLAPLPLQLVEEFEADGKSGDLNRYAILKNA